MITVAVPSINGGRFEQFLEFCLRSPLVCRIMVLGERDRSCRQRGSRRLVCDVMPIDLPTSGEAVNRVVRETVSKYLLWVPDPGGVLLASGALERFFEAAEATGAGMVYGDYAGHPVNDCQLGSIADTFDFGPALFFSVPALRRCLRKHGAVADAKYAGLYDLRLKLSVHERLFHLSEPLGEIVPPEGSTPPAAESHFAYVDPQNRAYQREMEQVATAHLKRLGAYLEPDFQSLPACRAPFPVEASVVIPVRNRARTIADAVRSALDQVADFPFNILVADNHSSDGTTEILRRLSAVHEAVKLIVPDRTDLGIGGCWNEAVRDLRCGRYAVQLDSDDLYSRTDSLQQMIDAFGAGDAAMVIGSYTVVNDNLEEIPPGLVDHREWTEKNGHNNALRINGLGAPRAFRTDLIRRCGFPNVSYGEDYAAALRISRQCRIGRIYDSLYLCRRWGGNTDASLPVETANRYGAYKDQLRTMEILARCRINRDKEKKGDC